MVAKAQMARWGNSLALRIPKSIAEMAEFREGDTLVMEVETQGCLAIKAELRPPTLDELVSQITPDNMHRVVDWGEPVGNEAW